MALEQRFFLMITILFMSMAAGLEVRVPFGFDLVEFAARIPSRYKYRGREAKWVLKKAMESYLPHDLILGLKAALVPLCDVGSG